MMKQLDYYEEEDGFENNSIRLLDTHTEIIVN